MYHIDKEVETRDEECWDVDRYLIFAPSLYWFYKLLPV